MISVVIIAKDEEEMIADALKSVRWADEVIVIDTGSTDDTVNISIKSKARVVKTKEKSFSDWRNIGIKEAKGDWILYLDADERITPVLAAEIKKKTNENEFSMYAIPRKNIILGREFKHGGFRPDYVKRLFKKSDIEKWNGELHEEPVYKGRMSHLINPMIHIKHESFTEMLEKTNRWSEIEAKLMFESKHPPMTIPRFLSAMFREFWHRMIRNRGFMDGPEGIMFSIYQVYSRFISYAKLWELQERERMNAS